MRDIPGKQDRRPGQNGVTSAWRSYRLGSGVGLAGNGWPRLGLAYPVNLIRPSHKAKGDS